MSLSSRLSGLYSCHYCPFQDRDPEVVFDHMNRRECQAPKDWEPEWRRRARAHRLPAKELRWVA